MEKRAVSVHVDIRRKLRNDHEVDERRDVDDVWDAASDRCVVAPGFVGEIHEHILNIIALC